MAKKYQQQPITSSLSRSHSLITKLIILLLFPLFAIESNAQEANGWQWAKSGGGTVVSNDIGEETNGTYGRGFEQILDIKTDADNNYYYLANVTSDVQIGGLPIETYNTTNGSPNGSTDILLFSTTADGTYRWHRVIGGSYTDQAWNIQLDNENDIYIAVMTGSSATENSGRLPIRFSDTDIMPYVDASNTAPQYGYKTSFILKYDTTNGELIWRKDIQGNVTQNKRQSYISQLQIDSSNIIHAVVGLREGTHLDGQVAIPASDLNEYDYYLVKYNNSGNLIGTPVLLPFEGGFVPSKTSFRYDETLGRYYFAGSRRPHSGTTSFVEMSYDNIPFTEDGYIFAIDAENLTELWRKEMITSNSAMIIRNFYDIELDNDSNIYLGGNFFNQTGITLNDYVLNNGLIGYIPVVIKLDADGNVLWHKIPDGVTDNYISTINHDGFDVVVNGDEVAFATEGQYFIWGDFQIDRPAIGMSGHRTDPALVRFNKETGTVVGLSDIMGNFGVSDALTAVTVDNDGTYVVGGYMRGSLFTDNPNEVGTISNSGSSGTDFFYAKLLVDTTAGTKDFNDIAINVYPNPTTDIVYFETEEKLTTYMVFNQNAQQVQVQTQVNETNYQMSLDGLASGTYFILLKTESGKSTTVKVVKE